MSNVRANAIHGRAPASVRAAASLIWTAVALNVACIGLFFVPTPDLDRAFEDFYRRNPDLQGGGFSTTENAFVLGAVSVLVAMFAILAVLAMLVLRGNRTARVATGVVGGIVFLSETCALFGVFTAPGLLNRAAGAGNPDTDLTAEQMRILVDHTPVWLIAGLTTFAGLAILAIGVAVVLLATPAANQYFRADRAAA